MANWYYLDSDKRQGPINDSRLKWLSGEGAIADTDLVWTNGMNDWQPFGEIKANIGHIGQILDADEEACAECYRSFARNEMLKFGDSFICASCKPVFVQKLKEGVVVASDTVYGGFWQRFWAKILDAIILWVVNMVLSLVNIFIFMRGGESTFSLAGTLITWALQIMISAGYATYFVGSRGATPGKMALNLKVVTANGDSVSYGRALARYFAEIVSGMTLGIGYIIAAFDTEKKALHDIICKTRVVKN
ncbi:MAG: DUF4339 domain-containing protein [Chitinivibrionales bacterium]|nr:DUF4339 domain-containing protein [Chitinivibrionales bacterium]